MNVKGQKKIYMKLSFNVSYRSAWGQQLYVVGSDDLLGNWEPEDGLVMNYLGNDQWSVEIDAVEAGVYEYKYLVREANGVFVWEGGSNRSILTSTYQYLRILDTWHAVIDPERVLFTKIFTDVIMKPAEIYPQKQMSSSSQSVRITLMASRIGVGYGMAVLGSTPSLGNWQTPVLMANSNYPKWELDLDASEFDEAVSYKYVIVRLSDNKLRLGKKGNNRELFPEPTDFPESVVVVNDEHFRFPVGNWKGAGVAVPVFSLRTNESFGVGEFNDLKKLVDWSEKTGLKMIQILPINETVATHSWLDSYPYKSITVMALHPMYLHLPDLGELEDKKLMDEFKKIGKKLNSRASC